MVIKPKYTRCGDYLLPEMGLSEEDKTPLGRYGEMRCRYLEENRPQDSRRDITVSLLRTSVAPHDDDRLRIDCQRHRQFLPSRI